MEFSFSIFSKDKKVIEGLKNSFKQFPEFNCLSVSNNAEEAISDILRFKPNLVFMDLDDKEREDPFLMVAELYQYLEVLPKFIALSKDKGNAYKVIKSDFIDLLLKPLTQIEFLKCILRFKKNHPKQSLRICLKSYSDYQFLDLEEIVYLQADNNTTDFHLASDTVISGFKTLKTFENVLPSNFKRVHNSYIININLVDRINFGKSQISLKYRGGRYKVPFSKSYRDNVNSIRESILLKNISICQY